VCMWETERHPSSTQTRLPSDSVVFGLLISRAEFQMVVPRAQPNVGNKHNPHVLRADEQPREMMRHPSASEKKTKKEDWLCVRESE